MVSEISCKLSSRLVELVFDSKSNLSRLNADLKSGQVIFQMLLRIFMGF